MTHGDHKPGKPRILRDFSENEKLAEFSGNSVQPEGKSDFAVWVQPVSSSPCAAKSI